MPTGSYRWNLIVVTERYSEAIPREGQHDALNHSKTKRIFAADVERHLQGMGLLAPVTTSPITLFGEMETPIRNGSIYELHNTPAPRKRVEV